MTETLSSPLISGAFLKKLAAVKGFGAKLKALRDARGWSQPQAAEHLGLGVQTISNLGLENTAPSLKSFLAVVRGFGVSVEYLCGLPEEDPERAEFIAEMQAYAGQMDARALSVARDQLKVLSRIGNR